MFEHKYSLYASTISIVGFILQLTNVNIYVKNIILFISIASLSSLITVTLYSNGFKKRKQLMTFGNKIILSTKEKVVLFGGDLSWTDDYINSIQTICSENKKVEIIFPKSKYENCDKDELLNRIISLQKAGAIVYSYNNDFGLRCILLDPDSFNTNEHMEIMLTERTYRHKSNTLKNKYIMKHLKYTNTSQKDICKSYIANYYYIKRVCEKF